VREGEEYAFTGFPIGTVLGLFAVTHRGIISAISPIAIPQLTSNSLDPKVIRRLRDPYNVYQLDATAYPGNSGSPLYDPSTAQVIGVIHKVFVK
jgi:serine protease Do